ncbi:Cytochrome c oxidase copper chaperone [Podila epigama]|nr:Cytochrome c oxidase copper chaperone [Podila epigama]
MQHNPLINMTSASQPATAPATTSTGSNVVIGKDGKPLKPCCACPETKKARDQCVFNNGEENCLDLIKAHQQCLRDLGFKI